VEESIIVTYKRVPVKLRKYYEPMLIMLNYKKVLTTAVKNVINMKVGGKHDVNFPKTVKS